MALSGDSSVLITGGCGFIGVNLARTLIAAGHSVTAFDNFSTGSREDGEKAGYDSIIEGDLLDLAALREAAEGHTHMVHLAAHTNVVESVEDPRHDVNINVLGVLNALVAARDTGVEGFVFASSNAPLGDVVPPSHENVLPRPVSPYGASKLSGEALCSAFQGSYGMHCVALRFSNVYGPYSYHKGSVIAKFMKRIARGEPLIVYGDGQQTRDFVYVDDICIGIELALDAHIGGGLFHLGTGTETAVSELVQMLQELYSDRSIEVEYESPRAGEILRNYSDISKARRDLGYKPSVVLADGLRLTKKWFESVKW